MIINIESVKIEDVTNVHYIASIENILRSFAECKHIIIAPRFFFNEIINDTRGFYSSIYKGIATEALRGLVEYRSIINFVSFYISVDFNIEGYCYEWFCSSQVDKLKCGPLFFKDSSQLQKVRIICENPSDSDFFKIIAFYYSQKEKLSRCAIEFNVLNGGGGSTKDIFERTIKNNEIAFCIVDNDKKHPKAPYGGTSSHFVGKNINKTGMIKILDVHEVESLLPVDLIGEVLEVFNLMDKKGDSFIFFKELCRIEESAKFYYDHKKGFELSSAWRLDKLHGIYWRKILGKMNKSYHCDCFKDEVCKCEPSCLTYEGFGDGLLSNAMKIINRGKLRQYSPDLSPQLENIWHDVGRSFFSWSCGPYKKVRVS